MLKKIKNIYPRIINKEIILYLFFGVCTTIISLFTFWLFTYKIFSYIENENINVIISNTLSFIISVAFAFITNKIFVFESKTNSNKELIVQILKFYMARIITFAIDFFGILFLINTIGIEKFISKVILSIVVIILNYILSKLIIFKKHQN